MSELVSFYVPITLPQVGALVAAAYRALPLSEEPYRGFRNYGQARDYAKAIADSQGIGFLATECMYPGKAKGKRPTFSFQKLEEVCPFPPEVCLERWQGEHFPFTQVSLAGTPHKGARLVYARYAIDDSAGDLLETVGFFRFDAVYPEATAWYDPNEIFAWDRLYNALARQCHLDDEDASEQGFHYLWECAQPFLVRLEDPPLFRYDAWTEEGYFICLDDTEYLAYSRDELGKQNPNWVYWAFETERLVEVLDRALQAKGIPERCYLCEWSNDSKMLFLTEEHYQILTSQGYLRTCP